LWGLWGEGLVVGWRRGGRTTKARAPKSGGPRRRAQRGRKRRN
jgi:hypothetical protein